MKSYAGPRMPSLRAAPRPREPVAQHEHRQRLQHNLEDPGCIPWRPTPTGPQFVQRFCEQGQFSEYGQCQQNGDKRDRRCVDAVADERPEQQDVHPYPCRNLPERDRETLAARVRDFTEQPLIVERQADACQREQQEGVRFCWSVRRLR